MTGGHAALVVTSDALPDVTSDAVLLVTSDADFLVVTSDSNPVVFLTSLDFPVITLVNSAVLISSTILLSEESEGLLVVICSPTPEGNTLLVPE